MSQDLSSAEVVTGALMVNLQSICTFLLCVHFKKLQFLLKQKQKGNSVRFRDQAQRFIVTDLRKNSLKRLSAEDTIRHKRETY